MHRACYKRQLIEGQLSITRNSLKDNGQKPKAIARIKAIEGILMAYLSNEQNVRCDHSISTVVDVDIPIQILLSWSKMCNNPCQERLTNERLLFLAVKSTRYHIPSDSYVVPLSCTPCRSAGVCTLFCQSLLATVPSRLADC